MRTLAILFVAAVPAWAQTVGIHVGSRHYPAHDFNNENLGAYVRWDNGITAGGYRNSYRRTSAYLGYTHEWGPFALTGGAISGYRRPLMIAPSVRIPLGGISARVVVLPKIEKEGSTVVHLAIERKF